MKPIPIVIPLHLKGGKHGHDTELRFALRSIEANFKDPHQVHIVGRRLPDWAQGLPLIKQTDKGLKAALRLAAETFPDGFFWFYDDVCILRPTTAAEMRRTPCRTRWHQTSSGWGKMLERIRERLEAEGIHPWDFSHPHGPYFFTKAMIDEAFRDWPRMKGKFPFESWILSKVDWDKDFGPRAQIYGKFKVPPAEARYLNYNNKGNSKALRDWLRRQFPKLSVYEATPELSQEQVYELQSRHLYKAWQDIGRPRLRTISECAVGPWSLLKPFEGKADRTLLIEPDPLMAAAAAKALPWAEIAQVAIGDQPGRVNLRRLNGSSYITGIPWAPAFDAMRAKARRARKIPVEAVRFSDLDDGRIDVLNLDCEGSEWYVLKHLVSRPELIQIELYRKHGHFDEITAWLAENGYAKIRTWGNANRIYRRASAA